MHDLRFPSDWRGYSTFMKFDVHAKLPQHDVIDIVN